MIFGAQHARFHRGIFFEQALRLIECDRPEYNQAKQFVAIVDCACRAELSHCSQPFNVALMSQEQRVALVLLAIPIRPAIEHAEWVNLHIYRRIRVKQMLLVILFADTRRSIPRMHVEGVAMFDDGGILSRKRLCRL